MADEAIEEYREAEGGREREIERKLKCACAPTKSLGGPSSPTNIKWGGSEFSRMFGHIQSHSTLETSRFKSDCKVC